MSEIVSDDYKALVGTPRINKLIENILGDKKHSQENAKKVEKLLSDALESGLFETSSQSSVARATIELSCVEQFIAREWKNKRSFQKNADDVKQIISDALARGISDEYGKRKKIKFQISARAKDESSLRKKLSANRAYKTLDDVIISGDIWDLAGVRVLVYFPDDVHDVLDMIMDEFPDIAGKPFVRDNKRVHKQLPERDWDDISRESNFSRSSRIREELKGPWLEQSAEEVRDWQHHGYTAVHLTVLFPARDVNERTNRSDEIEQWRADRSTLAATKAAHMRSSPHFRGQIIDAGGIDTNEQKRRLKEQRDERYRKEWASRVEIQITTVVMHAWSEVEHDLIYKNPLDLPHDSNIDRILDATNGLSITSEVLLRQLQQTMTSMEEKEDQRLDTDLEFESALMELYREVMKVKISGSAVSLKHTPLLKTVVQGWLSSDGNITRRQLRRFLQTQKDVLSPPRQIFRRGPDCVAIPIVWDDISAGIVRALGFDV